MEYITLTRTDIETIYVKLKQGNISTEYFDALTKEVKAQLNDEFLSFSDTSAYLDYASGNQSNTSITLQLPSTKVLADRTSFDGDASSSGYETDNIMKSRRHSFMGAFKNKFSPKDTSSVKKSMLSINEDVTSSDTSGKNKSKGLLDLLKKKRSTSKDSLNDLGNTTKKRGNISPNAIWTPPSPTRASNNDLSMNTNASSVSDPTPTIKSNVIKEQPLSVALPSSNTANFSRQLEKEEIVPSILPSLIPLPANLVSLDAMITKLRKEIKLVGDKQSGDTRSLQLMLAGLEVEEDKLVLEKRNSELLILNNIISVFIKLNNIHMRRKKLF